MVIFSDSKSKNLDNKKVSQIVQLAKCWKCIPIQKEYSKQSRRWRDELDWLLRYTNWSLETSAGSVRILAVIQGTWKSSLKSNLTSRRSRESHTPSARLPSLLRKTVGNKYDDISLW
jgi:hypothetical protein